MTLTAPGGNNPTRPGRFVSFASSRSAVSISSAHPSHRRARAQSRSRCREQCQFRALPVRHTPELPRRFCHICAAPELGQVRNNVLYNATRAHRRPQERAIRLIDAADHDCHALQRCRDGRWHGNVNLASASPRDQSPLRPHSPALGYGLRLRHNTAWVVGREFGRNAPSNHAVATCDKNSLRVHAFSLPANTNKRIALKRT